jgi:hypothetical protein
MPETHLEFTRPRAAAAPLPVRTNSFWAVYVVLILGALELSVMWYVAREPVEVTRPDLSIVENREVILTSKATNRTASPVRLTVRFVIGRAKTGEKPSFVILDLRDTAVELDPRTSKRLECTFPMPDETERLEAEVQILRRD